MKDNKPLKADLITFSKDIQSISKFIGVEANKINSLINFDIFNKRIAEISERMNDVTSIVSKIQTTLPKPFFSNEYRLFEVEVLNTVKLIDDTIKSLNLKGGSSSLVPKVRLNLSKKYFYYHKDFIGLMSGMGNEYISKPLNLLDLYEERSEFPEYQLESKEDLILDKLDEIRKEIEIIKNEKKKLRLGFSFNINNNELIVQGLRISFSRDRKQIPILHVISSDIEKKKWELDEIIEFMGEHSFDKNEMIKWNRYLQQHVRSINDKVKMQGFHGSFLEYKDRALIINI